mmetsp:Transcript_22247/g.44588  ORF Transcript_22247/g.44588 Transcript_22247/m.44588 type:complete len:206 (-) Transcript_22247:361-978(-)
MIVMPLCTGMYRRASCPPPHIPCLDICRGNTHSVHTPHYFKLLPVDPRRTVDAEYPHPHHKRCLRHYTNRPRRHSRTRLPSSHPSTRRNRRCAYHSRDCHEGSHRLPAAAVGVKLLPEGQAVHLSLAVEIRRSFYPVQHPDRNNAVEDTHGGPRSGGSYRKEGIRQEQEIRQQDEAHVDEQEDVRRTHGGPGGTGGGGDRPPRGE